jgi:AcrR family transcriptional regulator
MLEYFARGQNKKAPLQVTARQRPAGDTHGRIVEATRQLLETKGYAGMIIAAIAQRAEVSAQSGYAIFKSKTGTLTELLHQSTFGADYEKVVQQPLSASDPETRLRLGARIAGQIHDAQSAVFDVLKGAGLVAPNWQDWNNGATVYATRAMAGG